MRNLFERETDRLLSVKNFSFSAFSAKCFLTDFRNRIRKVFFHHVPSAEMGIRRTPRPGATESSEMVVAEVEFAVNCRITLSFLSFPCRVICNLFEFEAGFSFFC